MTDASLTLGSKLSLTSHVSVLAENALLIAVCPLLWMHLKASCKLRLAGRAASLIGSHAGGCLVGLRLGLGPLPRGSSHSLPVRECLLAWQKGDVARKTIRGQASQHKGTISSRFLEAAQAG